MSRILLKIKKGLKKFLFDGIPIIPDFGMRMQKWKSYIVNSTKIGVVGLIV